MGDVPPRSASGIEKNARRTPIRLAFFVDSMDVGGSELNAIRTLERLDRSRFALSVFHTGWQGPLLARYQELRVPMHRVRIRGFRRPETLLSGIRLARTLRRERIEILHAHDIYSNILAIPFGRLARVPVVIASRRWLGAVPGPGHVVANRHASRWATAVLANSASVARAVREEDGVREEVVKVIPNFVDEAAFLEYPADRRARLLGSLGIPPGAVVVGIVARLHPVKNHAVLIEAMEPLLADRPELHLLIIGEGPLRSDLEARVRSVGWTERIHFVGQQPQHPNPHGLLDVSVLCSRSEGFPNAVIEAMAAGKPVIATAVGGIVDAVLDGETGILVSPPGDAAVLGRALGRLLDSADQRLALGEAGRRHARNEYFVDGVLGRLSDWYESLLMARRITRSGSQR